MAVLWLLSNSAARQRAKRRVDAGQFGSGRGEQGGDG